MSSTTIIDHTHSQVTHDVKHHRLWFLIPGMLMVMLGVGALLFPFFASLAIELMVGWILVISGLIGAAQALRTNQWRGFGFSLLSALLSLVVGTMLLLFPYTGVLSLTLLVALFFAAGGIFRIMLAVRLRPLDNWGWLMVSGILSLTLAVIILTQWPEAATWVVGVLVGIDLIFSGLILIMIASMARRKPSS